MTKKRRLIDPAGLPPAPACDPPLAHHPDGGYDITVDVARLARPIDPLKLFGRPGPFEIEVGFGTGVFLSLYAQDNPDVNLLGVEKAKGEVYRAADKVRRRFLTNVRAVACDALYFLEEFIAPESVDAFHVYYSDPWPKKRHHKRRVWRPEFTALVHRALKPAGLLYLKTDVTAYFEVINEVMEATEGMEKRVEQRIDLEPLRRDYETNFQRKAREAGHPLHYQEWKKSQQR